MGMALYTDDDREEIKINFFFLFFFFFSFFFFESYTFV